jgi:hypothetical protein
MQAMYWIFYQYESNELYHPLDFEDTMLANSAIDRTTNANNAFILEKQSYHFHQLSRHQ